MDTSANNNTNTTTTTTTTTTTATATTTTTTKITATTTTTTTATTTTTTTTTTAATTTTTDGCVKTDHTGGHPRPANAFHKRQRVLPFRTLPICRDGFGHTNLVRLLHVAPKVDMPSLTMLSASTQLQSKLAVSENSALNLTLYPQVGRSSQ